MVYERVPLTFRENTACAASDISRLILRKVLRRSGGNLPGAVGLKLAPTLIKSLSRGLQRSVVVTGTNGKTTTNGLIADALSSAGNNVVCNREGNNMDSGIASALIDARKSAPDTASFECDELYTAHILPAVTPDVMVFLNLFRDQLDRYGEIDHTQDVLTSALMSSPDTTLVFNADDPLCASVAERVSNVRLAFGIDEPTDLEADRISDSRFCARCNAPLTYAYVHYGQLGAYRCPHCGWKRPKLDFAITGLVGSPQGYSFDIEDRRENLCAPLLRIHSVFTGLYMVYNITAAFVAAYCLGVSPDEFQRALDSYTPALGRMKTYNISGRAVRSNLAKNPMGFDRMIEQIRAEKGCLMAFFLNDNDADGHDVSWIWDVDFERLLFGGRPKRVFAGGKRAYDMALRLKYAGIDSEIIGNIEAAIAACAAENHSETLYAVANYTAFPPLVQELDHLENSGHACGPSALKECYYVPKDPVVKKDSQLSRQLEICPLRVVHLYPDALNLYGDGGNICALRQRMLWRGLKVRVDPVLMGDVLDLSDADIVLLGGGADRDQLAVNRELLRQKDVLLSYVESGGVLLAICGGYQLLGAYYSMGDERVEGLGILDLATDAGSPRIIGNIAITCDLSDDPVVGFENHAGRTILGLSERPLGKSLIGCGGNNGIDLEEGVLHKGVIGTYLHGPILPKNPAITDWLISAALRRRGFVETLASLDDCCEKAARDAALEIAKKEKR